MKDQTKGLLWGLGGGVTVAGILPYLGPVLEAARPLGKMLLKQAILAVDELRTHFAQATEVLEDLFAEARAEADQTLAKRHARRRGSARPAGDSGNGGSEQRPLRSAASPAKAS